MLISKQQQDKIEALIGELETQTDAEIVCVLATKCDDYYYIPALWAAIIALVSPLPLWFTPWWHQTNYVVIAQFAVFLVSWTIFRSPKILLRLIPKEVRQWRASNLAKRSFLENKLHHTANRKGVLVFVADAERYVEIFADQGIAEVISDDQWQTIVATMTDYIRRGDGFSGLEGCLRQCGALLSRHAPATTPKIELPNRLILLNL